MIPSQYFLLRSMNRYVFPETIPIRYRFLIKLRQKNQLFYKWGSKSIINKHGVKKKNFCFRGFNFRQFSRTFGLIYILKLSVLLHFCRSGPTVFGKSDLGLISFIFTAAGVFAWGFNFFFPLCCGICENVFHFFTLACLKPPNSFGIILRYLST
jgi:hypothetical protein